MKKESRQAVYTVTVPVKFTFRGDDRLTGNELYNQANKALDDIIKADRLSAYIEDEELSVVNKSTCYTREELRERKRLEDILFNSLFNARKA